MSKHSISRKFKRKLSRWLAFFFQRGRVYWYGLFSTCSPKGKAVCYQPLVTMGEGEIEFRGLVRIGVSPSPSFLSTYAHIEARHRNGKITISEGTWINNNFVAIAEHTSITIGKNCLIGSCVEIFDSDFHGIKISERHMSKAEWARPVTIGDDVFIGANVKIMKGVNIGVGSVIANGAVVVKDVPEYSLAGGNPARVIRKI